MVVNIDGKLTINGKFYATGPSTGKKKKKILTESNETYTECSRLQINDMCQTILEENVYWLSNEHRKTRKSR